MYVISYSIEVAFHPSLNITRLVIYRSLDQTIEELKSKRHFDLLDSFSHERHLDKNSRRQLNDNSYAVYQKSNNSVLCEILNVELKLLCTSLLSWFNSEKKILVVSTHVWRLILGFFWAIHNKKGCYFKRQRGELKRFSSTIIIRDENNQYVFAMTKPLPVGVIKKKDGVPTLQELEQILAGVKPTDEFGHMFIVDLMFVGGENLKILLYNELYPPFFEKDKTMESFECSCVQVMALRRINNQGKLFSIKQNSKTRSTLRDKTFFGVYTKELYHATTQLGWSVTCILAHYTFRQEMFKKDFVVKNQNARKGASSEVDKNFYKLMNNS